MKAIWPHKYILAGIVAILAPCLTQSGAAETLIPLKCQQHYATAFLPEKTGDFLDGIRFEKIPPEVVDFARKSFAPTIATYSQLPDTEHEYRAIFDVKEVTVANRNEMRKQGALIGSQINVKNDKESSLAKSFANQLRTQSANIIVLIGHNEAGDFKFKDGSSIEIVKLVELCSVAEKICVFISCEAKNKIDERDNAVGVTHVINFAEAISIANRLHVEIEKRKERSVTIRSIAAIIEEAESSARFQGKVRYLVEKGCGPLLTIGALLILEWMECSSSTGQNSMCGMKRKKSESSNDHI